MTDDEIKDLANEAGAGAAGLNVESASVFAMFKRFAKSIESRTWTDTKARWYQAGVEAEREACAEICYLEMGKWHSPNVYAVLDHVHNQIKARGGSMSMENYNFQQAKQNWGMNDELRKDRETHEKLYKTMEEYAHQRSSPDQPQCFIQSPVNQQIEQLQKSIACLENAIETLTKRLKPVLTDAPEMSLSKGVSGQTLSPITLAFFEANHRVHEACTNVQDLIERLEV